MPQPAPCASLIRSSPPRGPCSSSPMGVARRPRFPAVTQWGVYRAMADWGFPLNPLAKLTTSIEEMLDTYREIESGRAGLDYDIDGVVYKLDRLDLQQRLGFVSRSPRF